MPGSLCQSLAGADGCAAGGVSVVVLSMTEGKSKLLRQRAVVPFLFRESSLTDQLEFDLMQEGDRALKSLIQELDDIYCVRLATEDDANEQAARAMSRAFSDNLMRFASFGESECVAMAKELFGDADASSNPDTLRALQQGLKQLAQYAFQQAMELSSANKLLSRNQVYAEQFIEPGGSVALGQFRKPGSENPFVLELKKCVDLVYNTNLPDRLKRYTFTPAGLPSRIALQDQTGVNVFKHESIQDILSDPDLITSLRRTFMARVQQGMNLPLLSELTMADVAEIRQLPEWYAFKDAQANILKNPLQCLSLIDGFQTEFDTFQRALSDWFNLKYQRPHTEARYCNYVSLAVSLAGKLIVVGSGLLPPLGNVVANFTVDRAVGYLPQKVKGYAAKLMVNVYDIGRRQLDCDRSYSIELMQSNAELYQDDILELLGKIASISGEDLPEVSMQMADQGID
ncbi:hypothetical protein XM38_004400 [Halomicronema hongdechloris C2206]|uniref:Uncharacterized protein n=2 Tax=Halomicronema hongdechloris TaxID=1209493 RepID=A0A1Z3HGT2_9CYAN|nr:hypothetical protein XM38_004400 [Halomicronema hongdechloris C2206]